MKYRSRTVLPFAGLGVLWVAASLLLYALLHLLPPSAQLDWSRPEAWVVGEGEVEFMADVVAHALIPTLHAE